MIGAMLKYALGTIIILQVTVEISFNVFTLTFC